MALQFPLDSFFITRIAVGEVIQTSKLMVGRTAFEIPRVGSDLTDEVVTEWALTGVVENVKAKTNALRIIFDLFFIPKTLCQKILRKFSAFVKLLKLKGYAGMSSSMSVTNAAIGERSLRVNVTCANSGCPFNFSTTATTPSWRPTRKLSRWATS